MCFVFPCSCFLIRVFGNFHESHLLVVPGNLVVKSEPLFHSLVLHSEAHLCLQGLSLFLRGQALFLLLSSVPLSSSFISGKDEPAPDVLLNDRSCVRLQLKLHSVKVDLIHEYQLFLHLFELAVTHQVTSHEALDSRGMHVLVALDDHKEIIFTFGEPPSFLYALCSIITGFKSASHCPSSNNLSTKALNRDCSLVLFHFDLFFVQQDE